MRRPNIIWITIESTRADHTSLGEYDRGTTPYMRRIAHSDRGRSFDRCFSHGIWTLSSSASILTGTYPSHHGVGMAHDTLPERIETIPELLGEVGYRTGAVVPNSHVSSATGLDRGFDEFAWLSSDTLLRAAGPRTMAKYALRYRRHGPGLTTDTKRFNTGFFTTEIAKRWLRSYAGGEKPFFLYAFYGDPHHVYYPPRAELERFADAYDMSVAQARRASLRHNEHLHENIAHGCPFTDDEWRAIEALYDGEIAYTDEQIGELFRFVRGLDLENTVFVITADHGELFGEGGMLAHMVVTDDAVCHVPLVTYGLEVPEYDGLVQHADVMRTLLERAGARTDQQQGVDLRDDTREYAVTQRGWERAREHIESFREHNSRFDDSPYHHADLTALRTAEFKYLSSDERSELVVPPNESTDVSEAYPEERDRLASALERWQETVGRPGYAEGDVREGEFTDAMRRQLADLGYLVD